MSNKVVPWYESDKMWEIMEPMLFTEARIALTATEVDSIELFCNIQQSQSVLDLCCGIGRHSLEFARRGHSVVGVDRTELYLKRAEKAASEEKLDIEFVEDDMRTFS